MSTATTAVGAGTKVGDGVKLPLAHISIRVPWHDAAWNGTVCQHPIGNAACLILKNIHQSRDDAREQANAGRSWEDLQPDDLPACAGEHGGFMAPFVVTRKLQHPYSRGNSLAHQNFLRTPFKYPAYSAACVPFRWMLADNAEGLAKQYGINFAPQIEAAAHRAMGFETAWLQDHRNQLAMLDSFFSAVEPDKSLCFFYAKQVPLTEDSRRVLIGVGRVKHVGPAVEYDYSTSGPLRSVLWERNIHHSIRPDFADGFLLPYHQLLERAKTDPSLDLSRFVAFAPDEAFDRFSYGSEHVNHDSAIGSLLACADALREAAKVIPGDWETPLRWIDARLNDLWRMRGPSPGLGSALTAFGVEHGNFLAYDIACCLQENEDPWPVVEQAFTDPSLLGMGLEKRIGEVQRQVWQRLPDERRALLKLLARFDLTAAQATRFYVESERQKARIAVSDADLLANPYLLYELDRGSPDTIAVGTIDRGIFPDPVVREVHPLPPPSAVAEPIDPRRVRALAVSVLERAATEAGNTLLPRNQLVQAIRDLPLNPPCPTSVDVLNVVEEQFAPAIGRTPLADGSPAYQLDRLTKAGEIIRRAVERRLKGKRHDLAADWSALLAARLPSLPEDQTEREAEVRAREEKVAALVELAASRVSVLIGPAGTGKTTLLSVLCGLPHVSAGGVLLLTPTGKARVQLQQSTGITAQTIAQFLVKLDRYDWETGTYLLEGKGPVQQGQTVVIDEASMLTEEQLAATLAALTGVERLILVGDPRQLPPLGSGRPFVDIVARLRPEAVESRFPRVGQGYAELTVRRRQTGQERHDLLLAEWFSGQAPDPGADEIWSRVAAGTDSATLRFVKWETPQDLHEALLDELVRELRLADRDDTAGFEQSLGGSAYGDNGYVYFWQAKHGQLGAAAKVESWQILSPVRGQPFGVGDLNRVVQRQFRRQTLEWAKGDPRWRKIPPPFGQEEIVYGDKVINTVNRRRNRVWPEEGALRYVANGEIGVVVGQYKTKYFKGAPKNLQVEFASQPGYAYDYYRSDVDDEGTARLELAYAITVHKAQGSEFGTTVLILPQSVGILSRELLYTALTRQRDRVIVLHQGDLGELKGYASPAFSETARRLTNLFGPPTLVQVDDRFLEEGLIHRTARGELVRSKSEVIIANLLYDRGLEYVYEQPLVHDGQVRYPDFTIDDAESGLRVYWEHLGLLHNPEYRARWQRKLAWYRAQDIVPHDEDKDGGSAGLLLITRDDEQGGIDAAHMKALVDEVFGL